MQIEFQDYVSVSERANKLNCVYPNGMVALPEDFSTENDVSNFHFYSEVGTIKTIFRQNKVAFHLLEGADNGRKYIQNNADTLIIPTLFMTASFIMQNPQMVSIATNVLSNYIYDFFKGRSGDKPVEMNLVLERTKTTACLKLKFKGNADDFSKLNLVEIIKQMNVE